VNRSTLTNLRTVLAGLCLTALAVVGLPAIAARADGTKPYGDNTTAHIADRLRGTHRGGWLATVLDEGGYAGRRHAEEVKIPAGHGRRWVGIIHVPSGNAARARAALAGVWFAQRGTRFVLPLQSSTYTNGGAGDAYRVASKWAVRRLGDGWALVAP
jgi:hypothetical protein